MSARQAAQANNSVGADYRKPRWVVATISKLAGFNAKQLEHSLQSWLGL